MLITRPSPIKVCCYSLFIAILLVLSVFTYRIHDMLTKPMLMSEGPMIIELRFKSSAQSLIQMLYAKHLIDSKWVFLKYIQIKGLSHRLKAGVYQVLPYESADHFIQRIVAGDVLRKSIRIIEGTTWYQVNSTILQAPFLNHTSKDWVDVSGKHLNPEGLLLADTYDYAAGSQASQLLQTAHQQLQHYLDDSWATRYPNLPYKTPYDLLIAASILEKEAAIPTERKLISGVIINRLLQHMPLQMDPTVIYALGTRYVGKLKHQDLLIDSPYNTYRYRGLPPTPIAMVGKEAIDAAAHPETSNYLYFVAKGDGSHAFSKTYMEHRQAIKRYKESE